MGRTALILGAGVGGLVTAQTLRKLLPSSDRVVVIDRETDHVFAPSLLWLMVGGRSELQIKRPYLAAKRPGIELVTGTVERIDPERCAIVVDGKHISGDAMVVALGAGYALDAIPGLRQSGHCFYTLEGARSARDALAGFSGGRIVILTATPAYKCPAAPYEAALLIDDFLGKRGLRAATELSMFAAEPGPMMAAGATLSAAVRGMVEERGIAYRPQHQVTSVDAGARCIQFANGATTEFDLLLYVPPHAAPVAVRDAGLINESGWMPVDRHSLQTQYPGVYALGDITAIPLKMGRPLPKAGVFAHGQALVVAHNIARAWTGCGEEKRFDGEGACFIEVGGGRAGMGVGNFYAEPLPQVQMRRPGRLWHAGKVMYEKYWLYSRF